MEASFSITERGVSPARAASGVPAIHVQTVGQEGHEDVRLDAVLELVENRTQTQIVLQVLEGRLDLGQLNVKLPQLTRVAPDLDCCAADTDPPGGAPASVCRLRSLKVNAALLGITWTWIRRQAAG